MGNPNSPSSTVTIVRHRNDCFDYLVLCDSTVVIAGVDDIVAITDDRTARLPAYDRVSIAGLRNTVAGFWVASTVVEAADHAIVGSVPAGDVHRVLLCTDGVSRLVDWFGRSWAQVLDLAEADGPHAVIEAVRIAERARPATAGRHKQHDDASLVLGRF